jgi:hypothetical protein
MTDMHIWHDNEGWVAEKSPDTRDMKQVLDAAIDASSQKQPELWLEPSTAYDIVHAIYETAKSRIEQSTTEQE